jgi:conjugal transfer pilus assembly protein TraE
MKTSEYLKTYEGMRAEARWTRVSIGGLAVALTLCSIMAFTRDQVVVMQPVTLAGDAWISEKAASESYKEAWGMFLAQLVGNVTPSNVTFLKDRLAPLLSPSIFNEVMTGLDMQSQKIVQERIVTRFEPREVVYETTTDKVFVTGRSYVKGTTGDEKAEDRTYEYGIRIKNYLPMVVSAQTYAGPPRSEQVLAAMEAERMRGQGVKQ